MLHITGLANAFALSNTMKHRAVEIYTYIINETYRSPPSEQKFAKTERSGLKQLLAFMHVIEINNVIKK